MSLRNMSLSICFLDLKYFSIFGFWKLFFKTGKRDERSRGKEEWFRPEIGVKLWEYENGVLRNAIRIKEQQISDFLLSQLFP